MNRSHTLRDAGDRADKAIRRTRNNAEKRLERALDESPEARRYVARIAHTTRSSSLARAVKKAERRQAARKAAAALALGSLAIAVAAVAARRRG